MARVVGIDLGTTNSLIAVVDDAGRPVIVPNPETEARLLPSAVSFLPDGEVLVVGARPAEEGSGGILSLYLLDRTGELSWSRDYGDDPRVPQTWDWSVSHAALTPDGHVLVGATLDDQSAAAGAMRKYWVGEFKWAD